jgi:hypothetical protein
MIISIMEESTLKFKDTGLDFCPVTVEPLCPQPAHKEAPCPVT